MVFKGSSVLSCLFPARLGFGPNQTTDSPPRPHNQEKHTKDYHPPVGLVSRGRLDEPELDFFKCNPLPVYQATDSTFRADPPDLPCARANTRPSDSMAPPLAIPDGGIGESPGPPHRSLGPPSRSKRSSCSTFFAFSSKRRSAHGPPIVHIPQLQQVPLVPSSVSGRWVSDTDAQARLVNPSSIPSPLQTDEDEYYYSYYTPFTPIPSHSASLPTDTSNISPSKRLPSRPQDLVGNPDLDSQESSPVDLRPSRAHIHHPYAYSTPLSSNAYSETTDTVPPLRHVSSQPFQRSQGSRFDVATGLVLGRKPPLQPEHETSLSQPGQPQLKTSISTPNLTTGTVPARRRSVIRKKPPKPKGSERWLSAETWWDALLSPSPRFKVRQALHPHTATCREIHDPVTKPVDGDPHRNLGVTFPSVPSPRPRAVSITSVTSDVRPTLTRSRSVADLLDQPSTSATLRHGFEPAAETLVGGPPPTAEQVDGSDVELPLPEPSLSLAQVIDAGEAFEQQRAQWKHQASRSLGNKHSRSFSRARSKSLGSRHAHGHHTSESTKAQFSLEFLATRTLLGSQSTMPTVHVTKPSDSSSHSRAYSHSHSQSACSNSHTSHSRAYSHSHSHSLTTSNSSKSSRNLLSRGHSRNGSRSRSALFKAGVLCGIGQDDSHVASANENVPSSSRIDVPNAIRFGDSADAEGASDKVNVSPPQSIPGSDVGVAISSSPLEVCFDIKTPGHPYVSGPRHQEDSQENHWSPRYTHKSSEYAGPHLSAIDSNLAQLGVASDVSLRHRLPPRAAIHPPIAPILHPYRSATVQPKQVGDNDNEDATSKVAIDQMPTDLITQRTSYPHLSLSHADFEQYGVGEALVYAFHSRSGEDLEVNQANVENKSSPAAELLPTEEGFLTNETVVLQPEEPDASSLVVDSPPSSTGTTMRMVMSALDNPDHLEEFQDLFYKPESTLRDQHQELCVAISQVPSDVHSSESSSPLTYLVRKLSEGVQGQGDPSQSPSDSTHLQSELQGCRSSESETKFVFTDLARPSSSLFPAESPSQMHLPSQKGCESSTQLATIIPEDVNSSYTGSVLENPSEENENDTFGYPIKLGQLEASLAPSPIQSPVRVSTHFSIQEDGDGANESVSLSPTMKGCGLSSADIVRSSYLTTSDVSHVSSLSDFPLPPNVRPGEQIDQISILQAYFGGMPSPQPQSHSQGEDGTDMSQESLHMDSEENGELAGDVDETLRALRTTSIMSLENRRSTFGGEQ